MTLDDLRALGIIVIEYGGEEETPEDKKEN